jgi:hypothetical protein
MRTVSPMPCVSRPESGDRADRAVSFGPACVTPRCSGWSNRLLTSWYAAIGESGVHRLAADRDVEEVALVEDVHVLLELGDDEREQVRVLAAELCS